MNHDNKIPYKYFPELKSFLYKYTQDTELIANIIQTVYIWYFEKKNKINDKYPLIAVLKKRCLFFLQDYFAEQAKKLGNIRMEDIVREGQEYIHEGLVDSDTPLNKLIVKEKMELLSSLISELSTQEKTLLIKIILGNMPYKEVARQINTTEEYARLKVNRLRKKIKRKFGD